MRYLALDLGTKTLGIAVSDKTNSLSSSLGTIKYNKYEDLIKEIQNLLTKYDIDKIILGFPKNMNNTVGEAAERTLKFKEVLENNFDNEIILIDERLSTVEAENILLTNDMSRMKRKKIIDGVAAMIILDTYLRMKGNEENGRK